MNKRIFKEIIIIIVLILIGVVFIWARNKDTSADEVIVYVDGKEYGTYSLNHNCVVEIKSENGTNTLKIENGHAYVIEASCPDHICMGMNAIGADSPGVIVCLPNKVIVELND